MTWHEFAEVATPLSGAAGLIFAPMIGGFFGRRAASKNAEATTQDAFTRAYEAASRNWALYTEAQQKWNESQSAELARLSERQSKTEMALEAEKVRANKFEHLYSLAIVYLHRVFGWVTEHVPGEELPPPPPELRLDLSVDL